MCNMANASGQEETVMFIEDLKSMLTNAVSGCTSAHVRLELRNLLVVLDSSDYRRRCEIFSVSQLLRNPSFVWQMIYRPVYSVNAAARGAKKCVNVFVAKYTIDLSDVMLLLPHSVPQVGDPEIWSRTPSDANWPVQIFCLVEEAEIEKTTKQHPELVAFALPALELSKLASSEITSSPLTLRAQRKSTPVTIALRAARTHSSVGSLQVPTCTHAVLAAFGNPYWVILVSPEVKGYLAEEDQVHTLPADCNRPPGTVLDWYPVITRIHGQCPLRVAVFVRPDGPAVGDTICITTSDDEPRDMSSGPPWLDPADVAWLIEGMDEFLAFLETEQLLESDTFLETEQVHKSDTFLETAQLLESDNVTGFQSTVRVFDQADEECPIPKRMCRGLAHTNPTRSDSRHTRSDNRRTLSDNRRTRHSK